ncbi:guanine deaminase [bacterium]|nr:guanine deaminase [bacterium]MBP9808263.1 guanine deaminase [bacterium]
MPQPESDLTKIYLGHVISPLSSTAYLDYIQGALVVNSQGRIIDVAPWAEIQHKYVAESYLNGENHIDCENHINDSNVQIVDLGQRLILPGLVDLHLHLPQVSQTGRSGEHLLAWLNKYIFPAEARFSDTNHARKIATWFFDELAANGTTLAVVFTTIHKEATDSAFEVALQKGSRVIMGKVMMDANSPEALTEDTETSLRESEELANKWHGQGDGLLLYAFTPRFGVTSTAELLAGVGRLFAKHPGTYVHTHLSEAKEEIQFVSTQFPKARSYLDVYKSFGIIGKRTVFAHAIHLDDQDIKTVADSHSSLAHCPSSNFFLKSGVFLYAKICAAGCLFGLGSDVAAGPSMSLFNVMKDANYMQPDFWIEPPELLYRATLGGAKAAHLDHLIGSLAVGKEADFIVVDASRKSGIVDNILSQPTDEILSSLVFLGDDRLIEATYVRGRCIFHI